MDFIVQMYINQTGKYADMASFPYLEPAKRYIEERLEAEGQPDGEYIVTHRVLTETRVY